MERATLTFWSRVDTSVLRTLDPRLKPLPEMGLYENLTDL